MFAILETYVFLRDFKLFQHRERASQNAYKRNAYLMNLVTFLRNVLQNVQ